MSIRTRVRVGVVLCVSTAALLLAPTTSQAALLDVDVLGGDGGSDAAITADVEVADVVVADVDLDLGAVAEPAAPAPTPAAPIADVDVTIGGGDAAAPTAAANLTIGGGGADAPTVAADVRVDTGNGVGGPAAAVDADVSIGIDATGDGGSDTTPVVEGGDTAGADPVPAVDMIPIADVGTDPAAAGDAVAGVSAGSSGGEAAAGGDGRGAGGLPFTGSDLMALLLVGSALLLFGLLGVIGRSRERLGSR